MAALRNPYLSNDSQNFLLKKNYNVIKSPAKQVFYTGYKSNVGNKTSYSSKINNHQSATSIGNGSSSLSIKNPFSSKALGQRNENYPYQSGITPSFYTQPYLPSVQKKELPFPSYNRPQSNRGTSFSSNKVSNILSLSRRNLAVSNVGIAEASSLDKMIVGPYRPSFISPKHNNEWNTEKWKKQLQAQERKNLKQFGPQALRYSSKLTKNFNNDYYSTSSLQAQTYKYRINNAEKSHPQQKQKQVLLFQDNQEQALAHRNNYRGKHNLNNTHQSSSSNSLTIPRDPDTYYQPKKHNLNIKNFSDIRQESQLQKFQSKVNKFCNDEDNFMKHHNNSQSMMEDYKSFVKDDEDYEMNKFMSKYEEKEEKKGKKGPLDLDAFDSGNQKEDSGLMNDSRQKGSQMNPFGSGTFGNGKRVKFREEQSSVFRTNHIQIESKGPNSYTRYKNNSNLKESRQNTPQKDYPQRVQFRNHFFYRIKLNEDKK